MMLAFHNDAALKARKLAQVRAHEAADEVIKGQYWENGKGCAVGCTVHSSSHVAYETEMGIPQMLARLEDRIFEGMSNAEAKRFPARFIEAISVGADLSLVGWKFLHWLVADVNERYGTLATKVAVVDAIEILRRKSIGESVNPVDARNAEATARKAEAAAYAAAYAAAAAAYAADAAAAAAAYAAADARKKAFDRQAEKLLELLAAAPIPAAA